MTFNILHHIFINILKTEVFCQICELFWLLTSSVYQVHFPVVVSHLMLLCYGVDCCQKLLLLNGFTGDTWQLSI